MLPLQLQHVGAARLPSASQATCSANTSARRRSHLPPTALAQAAIDACSGSCGRVVIDIPGSYLTGGLVLTGCVNLEIPAGVALLASDRVRGCGCGGRAARHVHGCCC